MNVNCVHPRIIVNPSILQLLSTFRHYHFSGRDYEVYNDVLNFRSYTKRFFDIINSLDIHYLDDYYVFDEKGVHYPIYIAVKCGHCALCTSSKISIYSARLLAESQLYDTRPIFVTLTYDTDHLPEDGVSVRDCQLFFKRLRQNLKRKLNYDGKIRYYLCSEYGGKYFRPHYHLILFNLPNHTNSDFWRIRNIIYTSWQNGFVRLRTIDMKNPSVFKYTSKYIGKFSDVPFGKNLTFSLSSRRGGGVGAPFYKKFSSTMLAHQDTSPKFICKFSGKISVIPLSSYFLKYTLPSFCESIPVKFRNAAHDFITIFSAYKNTSIKYYYSDLADRLVSKFRPFYTFRSALHKTKKPNLDFAFTALDYLRDLIKPLLDLDLLSLKNIEYARKNVLSKMASSVVPLSYESLHLRDSLVNFHLNKLEQKKQLHYV